jgi:hypothetical protein
MVFGGAGILDLGIDVSAERAAHDLSLGMAAALATATIGSGQQLG